MSPEGGAREAFADRLAEVRRRIESAGGSGRVRVLPMTKGFGPDAVAVALDAGCLEVGESYAQELLGKAAVLGGSAGSGGSRVRWHFAGRLQRNKVRRLAPVVAVWQSVDRPELADEVARRAPGAAILLQVAAWDDPAKGGCRPAEVPALVRRALDLGLDVQGLMAIGPLGPAELARPGFRAVHELAGELGLRERSMGMSTDLEVAVSEGATLVRIGTDLFGERPRGG